MRLEERESGTARLDGAVTTYRDACTRERASAGDQAAQRLGGGRSIANTCYHLWTTPACDEVELVSGEMVRCSHMSGLSVRCV